MHIPYRAHLAASVVLTEGGDYLVAWRLAGSAFECADDLTLNLAHEQLNVWLRNLSSPEVSLWTHIIRRPACIDVPPPHTTGFAAHLAGTYLGRLADDQLWINEVYLTLVYRPLHTRLANAAARWFSTVDSEAIGRERAAALVNIEKLARQVEAALLAYDPTRLAIFEREGRLYSTVLEFLSLLVSGEQQSVPVPQGPVGEVLAMSRLLIGHETIEYRLPSGTRFGAMLGIKEYPTPTSPGMLNRLLRAPFGFVLTQSFAFVSKSTAIGLLNRQYHRLKNASDIAVSQAAALRSALDQLGGNEFVMGNHHFSLQLMSSPVRSDPTAVRSALDALQSAVAIARSMLGDAGMVVAREDIALESAFWAQLPANFTCRPRLSPITSRNFAAFSPFHNYPAGRATGNHWGDALTILKTAAATPYFFSLHASDPRDRDGGSRRDTGHTFVCGPTGSGKTVFVGFCIALLANQGATQVVFDKDRGLEILVRALGGRYLVLKRGIATGCNPLQLEPTAGNRAFLGQWLRTLIERPNHPLRAREEQELDQALLGVLALPLSDRRLSRLLEFLDPTDSDGAHARLRRWCETTGGELHTVFDSPTDQLATQIAGTPLIGFDMTEVLGDPTVRGPLTHYLFHLVESMLDGRRFVAWLDEFSKLVGDAGFQSLATDGTKTWRKRNGVIAFATQSPNDVIASPIARTIVEQTATKVFFPNPEALRGDYVEVFGLTEREFDLVRSEITVGSRRFLLKQGHDSVVVELDLRGCVAELKVISGRSGPLHEMEALIGSLGEAPTEWLSSFVGFSLFPNASEELQ
jgi:type IV secretion system protein VirB4